MNPLLLGFSFAVSSYAASSICFGLIIGKLSKGIDIRESGSGSTGATNVARTCGAKWGILALILDMAKAAIPLWIAVYVVDTPTWCHPVIGLAAIAGHIWPIFTNFKGGKGIASGWATLIVLSPWAGLAAALTAGPLIAITRYVSVGSIVGSAVGGTVIVALAIFSLNETPGVYSLFGIFGTTLTVILHHQNIRRLIKGEESKLGQKTEKLPP